MVAESKAFTPEEGKTIISRFAESFNISVEDYMEKVAKKCYMLVKPDKDGLKAAIFDDGTPQVFRSREMALNELTDAEGDTIEYTGFDIMGESAFWETTLSGC